MAKNKKLDEQFKKIKDKNQSMYDEVIGVEEKVVKKHKRPPSKANKMKDKMYMLTMAAAGEEEDSAKE